jgi:phage tail-like protein
MGAPAIVRRPAPPHDPTFWLLDGRAGWRAAKPEAAALHGVRYVPCPPALVLDAAPGSGRALAETSGSFGGLVPPRNVALGPDGSIYLLDAATATLKRFDPCCCRFDVVPCFGGAGGAVRQLQSPGGIATCGGNLFVCDTGNHRVVVLTLRAFLVRAEWRPADPQDPSSAARWEPTAIAFGRDGRAYVTDRAAGSLHVFGPGGRWERRIDGLGVPTAVTIDCTDRIYVVTGDPLGRVTMLDPSGTPIGTAEHADEVGDRFAAPPFEVGPHGALRLEGTSAPGACPPVGPQGRNERGVFDLGGVPVDRPVPIAPVHYRTDGTFVTTALDSELYRCVWHRVVLRGDIPRGASVEVATYTAEDRLPDADVLALPADAWETRQTARGASAGDWDCLVRNGGGRFLWLRLTLAGNGLVTPRLESVRIEFPRISLRRYLPAVFGEEPISADFTDRFLALFDTTLRSIEVEVDEAAALFDPASASAERDETGADFLGWLASWVGVTLDRHWPEAKRRRFLKAAGRIFDLRGTRRGLWQQLLLLLDLEPPPSCGPAGGDGEPVGAAAADPRAPPAPAVALRRRRTARRPGRPVGTPHRQPRTARRGGSRRREQPEDDTGSGPRSVPLPCQRLHGLRAGVHRPLRRAPPCTREPARGREPGAREVPRRARRAPLSHRVPVDDRARQRRRPHSAGRDARRRRAGHGERSHGGPARPGRSIARDRAQRAHRDDDEARLADEKEIRNAVRTCA